ncbi:PEBP-like protein [Cyathus striatus]|nr:PEBP-like protein [Cyathus striatus]
MQLTSLFVLLPLAVSAFAIDTNLNAVKKAFAKSGLASTLNIKFSPSVLLQVTFPVGAGNKSVPVTAGDHVPPTAVAIPPIFNVVGAKTTGPYVAVMVDPDAPTPQDPSVSQVRHFLASNFYGVEFPSGQLLVNFTAPPSPWFQPAPPAGSDPHRYAILLFKQPSSFNKQVQTLVNSTSSILNFDVGKFAAATGLGEAIGGTNFYIAPP